MSDHWIVAREWMQEVMGKQYPDDEDEFQELLQNGVELCNLANTILPDSIKRIREGSPFFERENVSGFIAFARKVGCPEMDLFCVSDLFELKNFKKVCMCILSVGRYAANLDEFEGPFFIGGKITYNREGEKEVVVIDTTSDNAICPTCGKAVLFTERFTALGQVYHKLCFQCVNCGNIIGGGDYCDHNNKPLCPSCYEQLYGTRFNKAEYNEKGTYRREENAQGARVVSKAAESIQEAFRPTREICSHPDCGKTVYPTEKLVFHGKPYHKLCFKCKACNRSIAWGEQFERDDDPYCRACYAKLPVFKLEKA